MIFIQIASYRDPQLPYTLEDCINKAKYPEQLRICIAHQFDETENLEKYENDPRFEFIKIPYADSKGVCWARHLTQQKYTNEKYTLQLDSHHRFIQNWDDECIQMITHLQQEGYTKPMLTGYLPSFDPENDPIGRHRSPWRMNFDRFTPEGVVFFLPGEIPNHKQLTTPIPSRFYSAHFCFTIGQFCKEVQHDPEYYFHGEEISIAVRAFTHGYDLFHPHKVIAWHEYTRKGRTKHWDDDKTWHQRNIKCHLRNKKLFGIDGEKKDIDFGIYNFGDKRTLRDYEEYSGICFGKRSVQQYTLNHNPAPNPKVDNFDKSLTRVFKHCIDLPCNQVPEKDYDFWCVVFKDQNGNDIFRRDASENEIHRLLNTKDNYCKIWREFNCDTHPHSWTIWPHSISKGWCDKISKII